MPTRMFEVQQKIFSRLEASTNLNELVNGVYDYVPEKTKTPYITFGQMNSVPLNSKTSNGEKLNFMLDIWSEGKGRKEAISILTQTEKELEAEVNLDSAFLISQKVTNREVIEENYGLYHAVLEIELQLTWEEN